jgi:thioredoxin reductase (NADPH)
MEKNKIKFDFDCVIVGGGPGGLISALYLKRFKRKVALINAGKPRAAWGTKVNNLIGYHQGISGSVLLRRISKQISLLGGVKHIVGEATVTKLTRNSGFQIDVLPQGRWLAKKVILATGIEDVHPNIPNLNQLRKLGLLKYCSICDGYEQRNKPVAVFVKDEFGIQKALFIANWTKNIKIIAPLNFKLSPVHTHAIRKIKAKLIRSDLFSVEAAPDHKSLRIFLNSKKCLEASVAYVELGCHVKDSAFKALRNLRRSKEGFIIASTEQRTSIPGLFAVGDCVNLLGQISVAAGQAAVAATTIHNDLMTKN